MLPSAPHYAVRVRVDVAVDFTGLQRRNAADEDERHQRDPDAFSNSDAVPRFL